MPFSDPNPVYVEPRTDDRFEVDDELLEIFRAEAEEILGKIEANLEILRSNPVDLQPIWEIRRCAHTFKGASGLAGQKEASQIAHRVEDLLDKLAEKQTAPDDNIVEIIGRALNILSLRLNDHHTQNLTEQSERLFKDIDELLGNIGTDKNPATALPLASPNVQPTLPTTSKKVSRVSLERIDELARIGQELIDLQEVFDRELEKVAPNVVSDYRNLAQRLREKLVRVRMIEFGTLAPRLNRAVYVTGEEEGKRAEFVVENGHVELDTEILDFLAEPLLHLLKNAAFHGIEKPEIRRLLGKPETGTVKIIVEDDDSHIVLKVEDDGGGISVDKLRRKASASNILLEATASTMTDDEICQFIFIPGLSTAGEVNMNAGRGVGMSIVKESVESRGGTISVSSEQGRGTEFVLRIPHASPFSHIMAAEPSRGKEDNFFEILVVDDSPSIREHTAQTVRNAGWKVVTANNGREALEVLENAELLPSIILTDLEMPEMDGYDLLTALKEDKRLAGISVLMITSRDGEQYRTKAFELGVNAYLTKPFDGSNLLEIVSSMLS